MIFRLVFKISEFGVGIKLNLGTESSFVTSGAAGGVIAAGILKYCAGGGDDDNVISKVD
jgi:hypothetical protein